ncbi:MAG: efflux RND transporter periplasmic adaptor subunit [Acidobacteria bacterium]|nr:efflux RND transporter periplasmic adaptor subunit [Acidobacteriota bacterium]
MKKVLVVAVLLAGAAAIWLTQRKSDPPEVSFAKVQRETLVSTLPTNGKVEPLEWQPVRSEAAGLVERVAVQEGQRVAKGGLIATLRSTEEQSALAAGEALLARAQADLAAIQRGGRSADLAEIANALSRARFDKDAAEREKAAMQRLVEKQAATRAEAEAAGRKVRQAEIEIESLGRKRAALVAATDRGVAEARVREAQAAVDAARRKLAQAEIRSPLDGAIYELTARAGAYLNRGDLLGNVGRLDRLRVRVYVDEPEVGRVAVGQPVRITWDALRAASWEGKVERLPTEIATLGTRQVGEIRVSIENTDRRLAPGANINAEIRTAVVPDALTIPKEAVRREGGQAGVFVLQGGRVAWRGITEGPSSATRVQAASGLAAGDSVALPGERILRDGDPVRAIYP